MQTVEQVSDTKPPMRNCGPEDLKVLVGQLARAHEAAAVALEKEKVARAQLELARAQANNAEKQVRAFTFTQSLKHENNALSKIASNGASGLDNLCHMTAQLGSMMAEQGHKESTLAEYSLFTTSALQVTGNANQAQSELLKEVAGHIAATSAAASSFVGAEQVEHEDAKTAKKEEAEASRQAAAESRL